MKKSNFFCEFFVNKNIPILPKITKKCPHLGEGCQVAAPVKFCGGRLLRQSQLLYKSDLTVRSDFAAATQTWGRSPRTQLTAGSTICSSPSFCSSLTYIHQGGRPGPGRCATAMGSVVSGFGVRNC